MTTESVKTVRLSKAASEFNVSVQTIIDFLAKKGVKIEANPNFKLPSNAYDLLLGEFKSDKKVKEEAEKIGLDYSSHQTISIEDKKASRKTEEEEQEDLLIKGLAMNYRQKAAPRETKPAAPAPRVEQVPDARPEPVETAGLEPQAPPVPEQEAVSLPEPAEALVAETTPLPETVQVEEAPRPQTPVILGKIDLDTVEPKSRKKKKEAPAPLPEEPAKPEESKEEAPVEPIVEEEIPVAAEVTPVEAELPPAEPEPPVIEEIAPEPPVREQGPNFMKTDYQKLTGPVILGKMELPEAPKPHEKKPVASSSDDKMKAKKKRKRIKTEGETASVAHDKDKDKAKPKFKDKKGRKEVLKPEVSQEEIQKQIKETLQRLAGGGKSKSSKLRRDKRAKVSRAIEEAERLEEEGKKVIKVTEFVTANELATMMNVPVTEIISTCMSVGLFVSINQRLDAETLLLVAEEFGYKVEFVSYEVQDAISEMASEVEEGDLVDRAPVVTVMGHVDHGKTLLLDHIRKTNVVAGEAGGITQHIGASEVWLESGKKITFLDTPGHEAFTAMRARGAKVTDVAIIIIAADDAVMPQTVEAINHAQAAGVPIVFAINKIDKPGANPEKIREQLAQMNILVEDWGGKYQCQEISAKAGKNIDLLLDKVLLEAEVLELKANPSRHAMGTVIESSLDRGRGFVAKVLVQNGTLRVGDIVLAGSTYGKVKAMYNERNTTLKEAGPATPVLLLGLNGAPQAGDSFNVLKDEREAKSIATKRQQLQREQGLRTQKHITLDEIGRRIAIGDFKELNLIVKGDVDGSVEALTDELLKLTTPEVQVNVIHKDVGQVTESDILLASASNAIIIAFQVRPSMKARKLAEQEQIDIRLYSVIYTAVSEIKDAIEGMLSPKIEEKIVCNIEVRDVFRISKVGSVAGCMVLDGKVTRNTHIRVIRNGIVAYTGYLGSLKRFKDDVKEVLAGYECGLNIENYNDIKVGDIIEGYEEIEVKRKL